MNLTVYVCFRPFRGGWEPKNRTVLNGLAMQSDSGGPKVKFLCWDDEVETLRWAEANGYGAVIVPWAEHYLFPGPLRSFKAMFEAALEDCETGNFAYMNGDIVLGPGLLDWALERMEPRTLFSLPRHNWDWSGPVDSPARYAEALSEARPEPWTALDLFLFRTADGRRDMCPVPPFLLTAGSMDSWIVARAGAAGWRRRLIDPARFSMLHIEHPVSHPLKEGAAPDKLPRWAFNCGVYAQAVQDMPEDCRRDTTLWCFEGAEAFDRQAVSFACGLSAPAGPGDAPPEGADGTAGGAGASETAPADRIGFSDSEAAA